MQARVPRRHGVASLRVGVVGAGWAARQHCRTVARSGRGAVTVVHDTDAARSAVLARDVGARSCPTLETLLETDLDAVIVATPPGSHRAAVTAALARGRAVFVEKPLARTVDDGRAIVGTAATAGTLCAVGYQWRAVGALRALDEDLAASPVRSMTSVGVGPSQRRPWFEDGRQSAGLIGERASHHIDLQRRIAGHVVSVQAVDVAVGTSVAGVDDRSVALLLRYASGAVGTVQVTEVDEGHPVLHRTDIVSAADSHELRLDPEFTLERGGAARAREPADGWRPFERQMVAFLAAVAGEADAGVACTAREALGTLEVVVAAEAAVRTGATVVVCGAGG